MERILLYNVNDTRDIVRLASNMRVTCAVIDKADTKKTLGELAESLRRVSCGECNGAASGESLMVFCDVTEKHLDRMLFELRQRSIDVTYKAVLTATNSRWNVRQMLVQMRREQAAANAADR